MPVVYTSCSLLRLRELIRMAQENLSSNVTFSFYVTAWLDVIGIRTLSTLPAKRRRRIPLIGKERILTIPIRTVYKLQHARLCRLWDAINWNHNVSLPCKILRSPNSLGTVNADHKQYSPFARMTCH
jgi:hypothetical protein